MRENPGVCGLTTLSKCFHHPQERRREKKGKGIDLQPLMLIES